MIALSEMFSITNLLFMSHLSSNGHFPYYSTADFVACTIFTQGRSLWTYYSTAVNFNGCKKKC